ncbi:unnamed protein product, partial [Allacma fusca]
YGRDPEKLLDVAVVSVQNFLIFPIYGSCEAGSKGPITELLPLTMVGTAHTVRTERNVSIGNINEIHFRLRSP